MADTNRCRRRLRHRRRLCRRRIGRLLDEVFRVPRRTARVLPVLRATGATSPLSGPQKCATVDVPTANGNQFRIPQQPHGGLNALTHQERCLRRGERNTTAATLNEETRPQAMIVAPAGQCWACRSTSATRRSCAFADSESKARISLASRSSLAKRYAVGKSNASARRWSVTGSG